MRKWLNISAIESDYSADSYSDDGDDDSASDTQGRLRACSLLSSPTFDKIPLSDQRREEW